MSDRSYDVFLISAFNLATGVSLSANVKRWPLGAESAVIDIEQWWNKPANRNRSVSIGEAARWYLTRRLNKLRGYADLPLIEAEG